jgi:hypothetical protein
VSSGAIVELGRRRAIMQDIQEKLEGLFKALRGLPASDAVGTVVRLVAAMAHAVTDDEIKAHEAVNYMASEAHRLLDDKSPEQAAKLLN